MPPHPHLLSRPWPRPVAGCMWCLLIMASFLSVSHKTRSISLDLISRLLFQAILQKAGHLAVGPVHALCQIQGLFLTKPTTWNKLEEVTRRNQVLSNLLHIFPQGKARTVYHVGNVSYIHYTKHRYESLDVQLGNKDNIHPVPAWVRWVLEHAWIKQSAWLKRQQCWSVLFAIWCSVMSFGAAFACPKKLLSFALLCWKAWVLMWNMDKEAWLTAISSN